MQLHQLPDTDLEISTFCLGTMQFGGRVTGDDMDELFNTFRDEGGNFFDTAHVYNAWEPDGNGRAERILGDYVKRECKRHEVVIATKGAHPPMEGYRDDEDYLSARRVKQDITESLERLQTNYIDLYWLHRDDPRIPVAEIIDFLHGEIRGGRIRAIGASNWTTQRIAEANAYALTGGMAGFVASQPRWHLAVEDEDPEGDERLEPGTLLALSQDDYEWHKSSGLPVIPYSPTAKGYFAREGEGPERMDTPRAQERLAKVQRLAKKLGATCNQVALAWLLNHPFPVFPILGTSKKEHLLDAIGADGIELSKGRVKRLADTV